ncbi:general secretion pathway protein GspK [Salinisphaera sp. RV14]|uniref:general secretion pathway protein GspK n=1 Tax=unclassified Salinisphaera TaxID=2649847 RepID=UPI003F8294E7
MTLVFLSVITLTVGYFQHKVGEARHLVANARDKTEHHMAMHSELNTMLYRLAVVRPTREGIGKPPNIMRVDNRAYVDHSTGVQVRLMDARGLISLRYPSRERLQRLLGEYGLPVDQQSQFYDALKDYTDPDNLRRINGAEKPQYLARHMAPPSNRPLRSVLELRRVYGWASQSQLVDNPDFMQLFTIMPVPGINPNAAPIPVLATLPRVDRQLAKRLVNYRQNQPLGIGIMGQLTGLSAMQMQFTVFPFPSKFFRITLSCGSCLVPAMQYNVALTPSSSHAPWDFASVRRLDARKPKSPPQPLPKVVPFKPVSAGALSP